MGRRIVSVIAVLTAFSATPALATGPIAPPPPSIVPVVPPMPPVYDWSGGYAGAAVGYSDMTVEDLSFGPGQFSPDGASIGGFVGYNFQHGSLVFGPELGLFSSQADGTDGAFMRPFELRNSIELRGRVGYAMGRALPYLALGVVSSEFWADHAGANNPADFASARFTGVTLAAGVDVMVSNSMFVRGEIQAVQYNDDTLPFYAGTDPHTIDARDTRVSIGVGWRF